MSLCGIWFLRGCIHVFSGRKNKSHIAQCSFLIKFLEVVEYAHNVLLCCLLCVSSGVFLYVKSGYCKQCPCSTPILDAASSLFLTNVHFDTSSSITTSDRQTEKTPCASRNSVLRSCFILKFYNDYTSQRSLNSYNSYSRSSLSYDNNSWLW